MPVVHALIKNRWCFLGFVLGSGALGALISFLLGRLVNRAFLARTAVDLSKFQPGTNNPPDHDDSPDQSSVQTAPSEGGLKRGDKETG